MKLIKELLALQQVRVALASVALAVAAHYGFDLDPAIVAAVAAVPLAALPKARKADKARKEAISNGS